MKEVFEKVFTYAKEWGIPLEATYDLAWGEHSVHWAGIIGPEKGGGDENQPFFWLMPENEELCFCVPKDLTAEALSRQYQLNITEADRKLVPEDTRVVAVNVHDIRLEDAVIRVFVQKILKARSDQLGVKMSKVVQAAIGGCIGR